MAKYYKMNSDDLLQVATELAKIIEQYKEDCHKLKRWVKEIENSSDWEDKNLKTQFITCANGYLSLFKNSGKSKDDPANDIFHALHGYRRYIKRKAREAAEIEENFSV